MFSRKKNIDDNNVALVTTPDSSKIVLHKATCALEDQINKLQTTNNINLNEHEAVIIVALDGSYSMDEAYQNNAVQKALIRLLPLAQRFDSNGNLNVLFFNTDCITLEPVNLSNYENYVKTEIINSGCHPSGGVKYSPVINQCTKMSKSCNQPVFVIFITDGDNLDKEETNKALLESSKQNIFFQFIGITKTNFKYLDTLNEKNIENAKFLKLNSFKNYTNKELYEKLLKHYPTWLETKIN